MISAAALLAAMLARAEQQKESMDARARQVVSPELERLLELAGVSPRTLRNWQSGRTTPPAAAQVLARIIQEGELEPLGGEAWRGFRLHRGELITPEGYRLAPDLLSRLAWLAPALLAERAPAEPEQKKLPGF